MEDWRLAEKKNWTASVCSPTLRYFVSGLVCKILGLYLIGEISAWCLLALVGGCATTWEIHRRCSSSCSHSTRVLGASISMELIQWTLALVSALSCPTQSVFFGIASGSFCLSFQISLADSRRRVALEIGKLYCMWTVANYWSESEQENCYFPLCLFLSSLALSVGTNKYYQDIAKERFESAKNLSDRECRISSLLSAIPDGLLVITKELSIPTYNIELTHLLGASDPSAIYSTLKQLRYDENTTDNPRTSGLLEDVTEIMQTGGSAKTLGTTLLRGRYLQWRGSRCDWGHYPACILIVRDNTAIVEVQNKLKQESASKSALIRSVSHELRTPTNAILNLTREVAEMKNLPVQAKEELELVGVCCQFLLSMINDLLDFSKFLAGKFTLFKSEFDIRRELHDIQRLFSHQCKAKSLDLRMCIDPYIPPMIYTDVIRFRQVLLNLLSNAVK